MITFLRLGEYGRLGNQLFQIAATLGLASRTGHSAIFPEWEFSRWIDVESVPLSDLGAIGWTTRQPSGFRYDSSLETVNARNINLEGYFQSELYFDHIPGVVRKAIMSDRMRVLGEEVARLHDIERSNDWCAVHVRRGDYLKLSDLYEQLSPDGYYLPAMKLMRANGVRRFMVVSDDPVWCRSFLSGPGISFSKNAGTFKDRLLNSQRHRQFAASYSPRWSRLIEDYATSRGLRDLLLMSACRHHIIANSSFSWWSSWLSDLDGEVIAPKRWFTANLAHDTADLYRPEMSLV